MTLALLVALMLQLGIPLGSTPQEMAAACEKASVVSCGPAGNAYITGADVPKDVARGLRLYRHGCTRGDGRSCAFLGMVFAEGKATKQDLKMARQFYERGCRLRSGAACNNLALMFSAGPGVKRDAAQERRLFEQGCKYGHGAACAAFGGMLDAGEGGPADRKAALEAYRAGCYDGSHADAIACRRYGLGILDSDPERAESTFSSACRVFGDQDACALTGLGMERRGGSATTALTIYLQACEQGAALGCSLAGERYENSDDPSEAVRARDYFDKACTIGNSFSCQKVGRTRP